MACRYEGRIVQQMIMNDGGKGEFEERTPPMLGIWETLLAVGLSQIPAKLSAKSQPAFSRVLQCMSTFHRSSPQTAPYPNTYMHCLFACDENCLQAAAVSTIQKFFAVHGDILAVCCSVFSTTTPFIDHI